MAIASVAPSITDFVLDPAVEKQMVQEAIHARENAYAPYSNYFVGSSVLAADGKIYSGCNVENAAYSPTICAERVALPSAVAKGQRVFHAVVVASKDGEATPCGVCRQVLFEFNPKMLVITTDPEGNVKHRFKLSDLLPYGFGPHNL